MNPKTVLKKAAVVIMTIMIAVAVPMTAFAEVDTGASFEVESNSWEYYPAAPDINAVTGVVIDPDTGAILYSKGMHAQRYPASITKVMTALVVLQNCDLNDQVVMTETGLADAYEGSSNVAPVLGEVFTVDQCLQMLLVKSANDIAAQLAEHVSGSVPAFADLMNQTAAGLGCQNTHFSNAGGLEDPNHYTSAYDMALIMQAALQHQRFVEIIGMQGISIDATNASEPRYYLTHNEMIVPESQYYYEGCIGGKTGYTDISQCTLVEAAERNGMRLIGVVMGSQGTEQSFLDMAALLDYCYTNFYRAEGTWGYSVLGGGTITIPYSVNDLSVLKFQGFEIPEGIMVSIQMDGRQIGSALMSKEEFDLLTEEVKKREDAKKGVTATPEPTVTEAAVTEAASVSPSPTAGAEKEEEMFPETARKDNSGTGRVFLYVAIAILAALILVGVLMIVKSSRRNRRKRK